MKIVTAVIQPGRLDAVKEALGAAQVFRLTVSDVQGVDPAAQAAAVPGGSVRALDLSERLTRLVKIEVAVNEAFVRPTVEAIARAGRTPGGGAQGDGIVLVQELEDVVRIRTGERGPEAI